VLHKSAPAFLDESSESFAIGLALVGRPCFGSPISQQSYRSDSVAEMSLEGSAGEVDEKVGGGRMGNDGR
jgi:hypothetical protein